MPLTSVSSRCAVFEVFEDFDGGHVDFHGVFAPSICKYKTPRVKQRRFIVQSIVSKFSITRAKSELPLTLMRNFSP